MNRKLFTGGGTLTICAVLGYTAFSYATHFGSEEIFNSMPAPNTGVQVADASANPPPAVGETNPVEPFAGITTESGGFTGDVVEGSEDAKVTIIEYASLTCPHCATFHETIYKPMKPDYIDTGKVRFIYRDFPLDNFALAASVIARCGGEKRFVGFIDLFMEKQQKWRSADNVIDELKSLAKLGGLGYQQVDKCLSDQALGQAIIDRAREGQNFFEVSSTPTVLINGAKFRAVSFEAMKEKLDSILDE